MLTIIFDFGFVINLICILIYLFVIIAFPIVKIGSIGLKQRSVMRSEEIWHKVHVAASLVTIPFLLISIAILFIENWLTKSLLCIPVIILCIVSWNIVIKVMTNKSEKEYKEIERKDLDEQIKKESGWR